MTATPIPRTLALTVYGDLAGLGDRAAAREPQADRDRLGDGGAELGGVQRGCARHLDDGRQAYVVCPLIEESETSQARAAEAEAERLRRARARRLPRRAAPRPAAAGRAARADGARSRRGELDVLVATTVIEVGVDVPNATIMIVQEADRFGLAQLHQLRGRVGRGARAVVLPARLAPAGGADGRAVERLEALVATTDGFELAERTSSCAARASSSARASRGSRTSASRACAATARCSSGRAAAAASSSTRGPAGDDVAGVFAGRPRLRSRRRTATRGAERRQQPSGSATDRTTPTMWTPEPSAPGFVGRRGSRAEDLDRLRDREERGPDRSTSTPATGRASSRAASAAGAATIRWRVMWKRGWSYSSPP